MPRSVSHPFVQQNKLRKKNPGETRPSAPKGHKLSGKRTGFGRNSGKVKCVRLEQAPAPPTRQLLSAGHDFQAHMWKGVIFQVRRQGRHIAVRLYAFLCPDGTWYNVLKAGM